ncbi:MAG: nucleoside phosphorylase [Anaerolineae bacterium]|uniref:nucleoside phosphorylase n=1 Tax=Promineifilum sp. TaxID=2664178 RepID=UPI001D51B688|nr:nucleoside phosphorylase [Anaerolineales bacterium]MCB8933878.1 nucleoside phosphorylase [Promineifilum sp.]MCO5181369.1 nucleoside phosphorylase [Promineifilum sp.]MCW5846351.1 nucleoside phosphorylase [Anaerolineae bacterium]
MLEHDYPILEHDPSSEALIEPSRLISPIDIPTHCVLCFFQDVIAGLREQGRLRVVHMLGSEMGPNPVYETIIDGRPLIVMHPGVGAPLAGGFMDELIALGCRHFVACGGAGVLAPDMVVGHVVVPDSAVRDEGTSYHYLPPSREVAPSPAAVAAIITTLQRHNVPYLVGKTWTTDAFYRETAARVARRRAEGCLTVEMEAATLFAVGRFRGVSVGQLLYSGDDLSGAEWNGRQWRDRTPIREQLFRLAAGACLML